MAKFQAKVITAIGNLAVATGVCTLWTVNINTGATSAVLTIYDNTAGSGTKLATIDASSKSSHVYGVGAATGIYAVLSGGNADVTIGWG